MLSEHELIKALRDDFAPAATQLDSLSRVLHNEQFLATSPEGYTGHPLGRSETGRVCVNLRVAARRIADLAVAKGLMTIEEAQQISKDY